MNTNNYYIYRKNDETRIRNRQNDRATIESKLKDNSTKEKTANQMIYHLTRYQKEGRQLSKQGYEFVQKQINSVEENYKGNRTDLEEAKSYLAKEKQRLDKKQEKNQTLKAMKKYNDSKESKIKSAYSKVSNFFRKKAA